MTFEQLILFCAASMAPADCDRDTAIDVLSAIVEAADATMCVKQGQRDVAMFAPHVSAFAYPKVTCSLFPRRVELDI